MNENLKNALYGDLNEYRSIPFWSWNNFLDSDELVRQIIEMKTAGIGGFIMHARTGLKEEYLGEKWFDCISVCLKKAKELNMKAWIYDDNGWPSGFVGGKLLENDNFRAQYLEYTVGKFDSSAFAIFIADEISGFKLVEKEESDVNEYHNIYLRISPANTDILNSKVVDAFINETHEKYYSRFKESFGNELAGFFTDEPQYYREGTPYSPAIAQEFDKAGEDVRSGLIWLFVQDKRGYNFRQKYFSIANTLYTQVYYKKIYEWCISHSCMLTGHSVEEDYLFTQMWGGASVMPTYEYESIPAIDCLCRQCMYELSPKQVGSVASQLGKNHVLTETFACCGYNVTPKQLKSVAESQYFHGVNMMCQHLFSYSLASQGKIDNPPVFSRQGNWLKEFKVFNDYFARLGYIISNTEERPEIAIIHPIREIWLDYVRSIDYESVKSIEESFKELLLYLRKNGISYHFVDESILQKYGSVKGNALQVGQREYKAVIVPKMRTLTQSTYDLLKKFTGKMCVLGELKYIAGEENEIALKSNISLDELVSEQNSVFFCEDGKSFITARNGEIGEFLFVKNNSMDETSRVCFDNIANHYRALNLETLEETEVFDSTVLEPNESLILIKTEFKIPKEKHKTVKNITENFHIIATSDNYLVMDYAFLKKGDEAFGDKRPITALFEQLLREKYNGPITVKQVFVLHDKMPLTLIMEKAEYTAIQLNGTPLEFKQSEFDINFVEADIGKHVCVGENELLYSFHFWQHDGVHFALFDPLATESLRNCLYYDTSIETAYLKGDFKVQSDMSLSNSVGDLKLSSLHTQGYPFFMGDLYLNGLVDWFGQGRALLELSGAYLVAELKINGIIKQMVMDNKIDITEELLNGQNFIEITLRSSPRNLFGPHHFKTCADSYVVAPSSFSFRGFWNNETDIPNEYTHKYMCMPFGIDEINLIKIV